LPPPIFRTGTVYPVPALASITNFCSRNKYYYFPHCWKALQQLCHNRSSKKKNWFPTSYSLYLPLDVEITSIWPSVSPACRFICCFCISTKCCQTTATQN